MNTAQFALNKELLEAAEMCDLGKVEELLKQDADPLGSPDERDPEEHILGELFCSSVDDEKLAETMPDLLRLFLPMGWILQPETSRLIPKTTSTRCGTWPL